MNLYCNGGEIELKSKFRNLSVLLSVLHILLLKNLVDPLYFLNTGLKNRNVTLGCPFNLLK